MTSLSDLEVAFFILTALHSAVTPPPSQQPRDYIKTSAVKPQQHHPEIAEMSMEHYLSPDIISAPLSRLLPIWDVFGFPLRKQTQLSLCCEKIWNDTIKSRISLEPSLFGNGTLCKTPPQIQRTRADLKVPEHIAVTAIKGARLVSVCHLWLTAKLVEQILSIN